MSRVGKYIEVLLRVPVHFVGEELMGSADYGPGITLYVRNCLDSDELLHVLSHEVVHHAHPDLNESAVDAKAVWLRSRPKWRAIAESVLVEGLLRLVHNAASGRKMVCTVDIVEEAMNADR